MNWLKWLFICLLLKRAKTFAKMPIYWIKWLKMSTSGSQSMKNGQKVSKNANLWSICWFQFLFNYSQCHVVPEKHMYASQEMLFWIRSVGTLWVKRKRVMWAFSSSFQHHDNVSQSWAPEDVRAPGVRRMREKDPRQVNLILMSLFKKYIKKQQKHSL